MINSVPILKDSRLKIFKTKHFAKWSKKTGLNDDNLMKSVTEIENGLVDAVLGGNLIKKRIAINKNKRGGGRVIVAYKHGNKVFFLFGFEKNDSDNISKNELAALKIVGNTLLTASEQELLKLLSSGELVIIGGKTNV